MDRVTRRVLRLRQHGHTGHSEPGPQLLLPHLRTTGQHLSEGSHMPYPLILSSLLCRSRRLRRVRAVPPNSAPRGGAAEALRREYLSPAQYPLSRPGITQATGWRIWRSDWLDHHVRWGAPLHRLEMTPPPRPPHRLLLANASPCSTIARQPVGSVYLADSNSALRSLTNAPRVDQQRRVAQISW